MTDTMEPEILIDAGDADESTVQEVYRNLRVLYGTRAGEQALDRDFGISQLSVDAPSPEAEAEFTAEFVKKTQKYEPRARVTRVDWTNGERENGNVHPRLEVELV